MKSRAEKAVVLLSGGIDSATTLYYARSKGYKTYCITFDYNQRHKREISSAKIIAGKSGSIWQLVRMQLPWKGSSLLDKKMTLPRATLLREDIPNTYVPGRNIIFLSYAVSYAETIGASDIFIGANQIDYSGYPDCRGSFLKRFEDAVNKGTRGAVLGRRIRIISPLLNKSKADIIKTAIRLKVPIEYTWSCYKGAKAPCGECDSCLIRRDGFNRVGVEDPIAYGQR